MSEQRRACLAYMSPAGTTRKVGRWINSALEERGFQTSELDLGKQGCEDVERFVGEKLAGAALLVVGSPAYADHILYPVESFLESLPASGGTPALVYATFGGVSKGITLSQMTMALHRKGYRVKGAAKVLGVHSMFFRSRQPLSQGHPDEEDRRVLEEWMDLVSGRLRPEDPHRLDPRSVETNVLVLRLLVSTVFNMRVMGALIPKHRFRSLRCRRCGACQARCPTGRLKNLPPGRGDRDCIYCMECVRVCPTSAFDASMWMVPPFVRLLQKLVGRWEEQCTKYYL